VTTIQFTGTQDASSGVFAEGLIWVLSDEDSILRAYCLGESKPVRQVSWKKTALEVDWEASVLGPEGLWLCGSFGRDKKARRRKERETLALIRGFPHSWEAMVQSGLVALLTREPQHEFLNLLKASTHAVKTAEGLNIEGLDLHPDGGLLMGLRGPTYQQQAIFLHLKNPVEVLQGKKAVWGPPILWDLGGLACRGLENSPLGLFILAGPSEPEGHKELWLSVNLSPPKRLWTFPLHFNPESLIWVNSEGGGLLVISDDGALHKKNSNSSKSNFFQALLYSQEELLTWIEEGLK